MREDIRVLVFAQEFSAKQLTHSPSVGSAHVSLQYKCHTKIRSFRVFKK